MVIHENLCFQPHIFFRCPWPSQLENWRRCVSKFLMFGTMKALTCYDQCFSPNSVATLWGSYGNRKNIWCKSVVCAPVPWFCGGPLGEKFPSRSWICISSARNGVFYFGGAFSPARRVDWEACKLWGLWGLLEIGGREMSWKMYIFRGKRIISCSWSLSWRARNARFVELSSNVDRLCWNHFAWQLHDFVYLGFIFRGRRSTCVTKHGKIMKNRISYWDADFKARSDLWFLKTCGADFTFAKMQPSQDFAHVGSLWLKRRGHFVDGIVAAWNIFFVAHATLCGVCARRIALAVAPCRFWFRPRNPLGTFCVLDLDRSLLKRSCRELLWRLET